MKLITIIAAVAALAGCATQRSADDVAECTTPVTHNIGMNVRLEGCSTWTFGARFRGPMNPAPFPMGAH